MTEITDTPKTLAPAVERFILHWGDMGNQWGVNRSVAQIHALLYLSARSLTAEEIAETLGLARSNVSNSIKELLGWKLIRRVPVLGDRRDHFEAETDIWEMVRRIAAGRKEREIDPAAQALRACVAEADGRQPRRPARPQAPAGDAGLHRDLEPLVPADDRSAEVATGGPDQIGRQGNQASLDYTQDRRPRGDRYGVKFFERIFLLLQK
jgi:DNA-binding transcriptional regulator GbsR (MarR family)